MRMFFLLGYILSFSPEMYCWKNESWLTDAQPYWLGTPTTNGGELASVVMLTPLLCIMYQHLIHHHASGLKIFNSVLFMILVRHLHRLNHVYKGLGYLPGGHLPPPKFGHLPPPNSDISHPPKKTFARRTTATPNFFLLFLAHFSWLFRLTAHGGHQGWEGGGA